MAKILMSGKCRMDYIGKETGLIDSYGEKLFTGDLVALSSYYDYDPELFSDFYGLEYVCGNSFRDDGCESGYYVMGVRMSHEKSSITGETIIVQDHDKWRLRKVKSYNDIVNGEKWGVVRCEFVEDDFCVKEETK